MYKILYIKSYPINPVRHLIFGCVMSPLVSQLRGESSASVWEGGDSSVGPGYYKYNQ